MNPIDYVIIFVILVVIGLAGWFMYRSKKNGKKCIGCPDSGKCGQSCGNCSCGGGCKP